jgi:hypothetical protein
MKVAALLPFSVVTSAIAAANMAVFYNENDTMLYAGIIEEWPMIIAADIEWGMVDRKDATKPPFARKKVKFFSPFPGN